MKIPIIIDNNLVQIELGGTIIEAAKKAGISIPTLCYHEAIKPYGACRLCMVELVQRQQRRLVTSCNYPVEPGMEVYTDTARLRQIRRNIIELLLVRCPDDPTLTDMARHIGIESTNFFQKGNTNCILCGLCVRFCEEVVGAGAIGLANRGTQRSVSTPFSRPTLACIGCGSCTYICPTNCIEMVAAEESGSGRRLSMGNISDERCPNSSQCETCQKSQEFFVELKQAVEVFRKEISKE